MPKRIFIFDLDENRVWGTTFASVEEAKAYFTEKKLRACQTYLLLQVVGEVTQQTNPEAYG